MALRTGARLTLAPIEKVSTESKPEFSDAIKRARTRLELAWEKSLRENSRGRNPKYPRIGKLAIDLRRSPGADLGRCPRQRQQHFLDALKRRVYVGQGRPERRPTSPPQQRT